MFVSSPFLAPSTLPSSLRQDSLSVSVFAGDTFSSNSIDSTSPRSPGVNAVSESIGAVPHIATSRQASHSPLELSYKTKGNEQDSPIFTPKAPTQSPQAGIYPLSPLLRACLQEEDPGYESEPEDEGCRASRPRPKRYRRDQYGCRVRLRGVTAPVIPAAGEKSPLLGNSIPPVPTNLPSNRPSRIDLASIPPYPIKPQGAKAAIGLGLGLPSNHPLHTPRASTMPALFSPQFSPPSAPYLQSRPFSPYAGDVQNLRLSATVMLDSPSPTEMLPPRVSYFRRPTCPTPLQASQLPSSPNDAVSARLESAFVDELLSPTALYSSRAYDIVCPPTPCGSPEFRSAPASDCPKIVLTETSMNDYFQGGVCEGRVCDL